jgi:hypothetical protein
MKQVPRALVIVVAMAMVLIGTLGVRGATYALTHPLANFPGAVGIECDDVG